ncbi:UPF0682 family protein [Dictyostelium discoideum AX4]|uniref:Protein SCAI homolog n=1 Tax=Dictyostelium discoideum TaxID=44689 RepID=SCAI_DICDI|nr:UPF0682 family protein [Dictyostelium discoideum AX4]Q54YY1.1 RecName: Full=Protein SCAI homolog [Dictyostelium discoideum]EAL68180.1 UPF0682 family protein [Dictyostelium discoideum AX4]|eukprot:XP_642071.1 UPF0682 family protein [Dictyostelium discoideum AX4]
MEITTKSSTTTDDLNNNNNKTVTPIKSENSATGHTSPPNNSTTTTTSSTSAQPITVLPTEIIKTFEHLLRKSQRLFIGLRDLPQFGRQWQPFFQKTFELYTKLWKFQQQYRSILEDKSKYGLKRCEIGEIASKIGQLYYHYYLRTSDTNYLNESYIFYEAIRLRSYFKDVSLDKTPDMMVKQLRYYARFIVVCLLLNKKKVVFDLIEELLKHVNDYTKIYKPSDAQEWSLVLQEIFSFLQADQCATFSDTNQSPSLTNSGNIINNNSNSNNNNGEHTNNTVQSHRLNHLNCPSPPFPLESTQILQQAILVGSQQNQIKFSEITLDMFRMTQSLEYEPMSEAKENDMKLKQQLTALQQQQQQQAAEAKEKNNGTDQQNTTIPSQPLQQHLHHQQQQQQNGNGSGIKKRNPHKYLLYRPTISQILLFLSYSFKELGDNKAMLLYICADGFTNEDNHVNQHIQPPPSIQQETVPSLIDDSNTNIPITTTATATNPLYNKLFTKGLTLNMQKPSQAINSPTVNNNNNNTTTNVTVPTTTTTATNVTAQTTTTTTTTNSTSTSTTSNIPIYKYNEAPFNTKVESLYPMDLLPFCRKPFFLIVNSQSSDIFNELPTFNQPFVSLLSPQSIPKKLVSNLKCGNLFTFFLHDPISAFCDISCGNKIPSKTFNNISLLAQNSLEIISKLLFECVDLHPSFSFFLLDDFLRSFIIRFIFCHATFYLHKEFQDNIYQVKSNPPLPKSLLYNQSILKSIHQLVSELDVSDQFLGLNENRLVIHEN